MVEPGSDAGPTERTTTMTGYNLMKVDDRARFRADHVDMLRAIENGTWPRTTDEAMAFSTTDSKRLASIARESIRYIDGLNTRLAQNVAVW